MGVGVVLTLVGCTSQTHSAGQPAPVPGNRLNLSALIAQTGASKAEVAAVAAVVGPHTVQVDGHIQPADNLIGTVLLHHATERLTNAADVTTAVAHQMAHLALDQMLYDDGVKRFSPPANLKSIEDDQTRLALSSGSKQVSGQPAAKYFHSALFERFYIRAIYIKKEIEFVTGTGDVVTSQAQVTMQRTKLFRFAAANFGHRVVIRGLPGVTPDNLARAL